MSESRPWTVRDLLDGVPICGCGNPEQAWAIVLEMLERAEDHDARGSFYAPAADASARWVQFAAHVLAECEINLLEHGTGIGFAWLTPAGKAVLAFLRAHGTDPERWPEEATGIPKWARTPS